MYYEKKKVLVKYEKYWTLSMHHISKTCFEINMTSHIGLFWSWYNFFSRFVKCVRNLVELAPLDSISKKLSAQRKSRRWLYPFALICALRLPHTIMPVTSFSKVGRYALCRAPNYMKSTPEVIFTYNFCGVKFIEIAILPFDNNQFLVRLFAE